MAYCKKTYIAGKTIIIEKGYRTEYQAGSRRKNKENVSKEAVKNNNEKMAIKKLTLLMNANFKIGDLHLVLTYRKEDRPHPEEARKNLEKFIRKLRALYRKENKELKYIHTTEYKSSAIHHHLLINYFDIAEISKLWKHGMVRPCITYTHDLSKLAEYFIKETSKTFREETSASKQRYIPSRNLYRPQPKVEKIHSRKWNDDPKPMKGYYVFQDSLVNGVNEMTGFPYQYYIMIELEGNSKIKKE